MMHSNESEMMAVEDGRSHPVPGTTPIATTAMSGANGTTNGTPIDD